MNFPGGSGLYVLRTDTNFPGGLIEKTRFFKEVLSVHRTDTNFPRNPYLILEHTNFPGASIFSSNRYSFSRKPYLVLGHIRFSRRPLCLEHIGIFQEGTPSRTGISLIGLGGCFGILYMEYTIPYMGNTVDFLPYMVETV